MADFFDGKKILKSVHTPYGIKNGWLQISGKGAVKVPDCVDKYWKIDNGAIREMTDDEKLVVDNPPVIEDPRIKKIDAAIDSGIIDKAQGEMIKGILD